MEKHEAEKIFQVWQDFMEVNEKLSKYFLFFSLPESLLPYPKKVIEDALNVIAESAFNTGQLEMSDAIKNSILILLRYSKDEDALNEFLDFSLFDELQKQKYRQIILSQIKVSRDYWLSQKTD